MWQLNEGMLLGLLKDFYTLTNIQIVLIDSQFREVLRYPNDRIAFCSLIRQNPLMDARCIACDREGCASSLKTRKLTSYRCYAGLIEAVQPIFEGSSLLGYIMFGQIMPKERISETKRGAYEGFPEALYPGITRAIECIPSKSQAEINAAGTVLQAITQLALSSRWLVPKKNEFIEQLDRYIDESMRMNISVEALCERFHISRTRLYALSGKYLGCGLAQYVRARRIDKAKELLRGTNKTVEQVAYETGFSDYNHFSRVFRKDVGVSASAFRRTRDEL